jgi:hypothetical protein
MLNGLEGRTYVRFLELPVAVVVTVMWLVGAVLNRYERSGSVPRGAGLGSDAGGGVGATLFGVGHRGCRGEAQEEDRG